uniref:recombination-associated protein RdgC n=1 Tax=uncultured Desulfovibrio sp. TaxID=167968 RepID=UPI00320ABF77
MAGFLGNTTSFSLFEAPVPQRMDFADAVRALPFSDAVTPEGKRMGWVGLGNAVDTDFSFGIDHGRFVALSLRVDSRKASGAALKLQLAEAVQAELAQGKKVSGKRKKELKEAITAKLISRAEWTPALTDCLWDLENGRLLVAASPKAALPLLAQFKATFGVDAQAFAAGAELPSFFARLSREDVALNGWELSCAGSATLATSAQTEDKGAVAVQNCESSIASALNEGLTIQKL